MTYNYCVEWDVKPLIQYYYYPRVAHGNRTQPNVAKREEINGADGSRIRWRRIVNVNVTIEIRSLVSEAPKHFKLAMASRRVAFSGNTSLIAIFTSFPSCASYSGVGQSIFVDWSIDRNMTHNQAILPA